MDYVSVNCFDLNCINCPRVCRIDLKDGIFKGINNTSFIGQYGFGVKGLLSFDIKYIIETSIECYMELNADERD